MPYVKRDDQNKVCGLYTIPTLDTPEYLEESHADVVAYRGRTKPKSPTVSDVLVALDKQIDSAEQSPELSALITKVKGA